MAASFAVFGTGSDTVNSLRSPAASNSIFSIRPTRGLISRRGIIPISTTQDVIGPIARTVKDVAVALTVMSSIGYDSYDNDTARVPSQNRNIDYVAALNSAPPMKELRLGLLEGFFNRTDSSETTPVNDVMDQLVSRLTAAGVEVIHITDTVYNATAIQALDTQRYEYRENMNNYLQRSSLKGSHPDTLDELYETNSNGTGGKFLVIPSQYEYVTTSLKSSTGGNATYDTVQAGIANLTVALQSTFAAHNLDAVIYPEQKNLVVKIGSASQSGRNGILAALTGSPVVTIPAGFSPKTDTAPIGVPIGFELLGEKWTEAKLLGIASQFETLLKTRRAPLWAREVVEVTSAANSTKVPSITPSTKNIPKAYPIGTLGGAVVSSEGVNLTGK